MTFSMPDDPRFARAARIRRGTERLAPEFEPFATRFADAFGVRPLDISTDSFSSGGTTIPRLGIVLERTREQRAFTDTGGNYDRTKQQRTASLFIESIDRARLASLFGITPHHNVDWPTDLFVFFGEFEQTAIAAAHKAVRGKELDDFVAALELGDAFWRTQRFAGPPIVFVHTDSQAAALRTPEVQRRWADDYYPIVERHDEFGYLSRDHIHIQVDSRETFERDFAGNWYYYFK